jgi:hypothetical protein
VSLATDRLSLDIPDSVASVANVAVDAAAAVVVVVAVADREVGKVAGVAVPDSESRVSYDMLTLLMPY